LLTGLGSDFELEVLLAVAVLDSLLAEPPFDDELPLPFDSDFSEGELCLWA